MIVSVYFAKDRDEPAAFVGDYDDLREAGSARMMRFSAADSPDCPVAILHGPAKDPLKSACEAKNPDADSIAEELDKLRSHVAAQLRHCGISGIENAEIRLFVHFGAQSWQDVKNINKKLAECGKTEKFQCFAVSRYNRMPEELYPTCDGEITPPRTENAINRMCETLGGKGGNPRGDRENIRAFSVLCQALAMLPEAERQKHLKGDRAKAWWEGNWFKHQKDTPAETEKVTVKELPDKIKAAVSAILEDRSAGDMVYDDNRVDISNLNPGLIAEIAARKLRGQR